PPGFAEIRDRHTQHDREHVEGAYDQIRVAQVLCIQCVEKRRFVQQVLRRECDSLSRSNGAPPVMMEVSSDFKIFVIVHVPPYQFGPFLGVLYRPASRSVSSTKPNLLSTSWKFRNDHVGRATLNDKHAILG